ncbi:MAG: sensor histidine kinase [Bacteroidetes bacterium]|nr:sensor histidine kinase [Bacteroidota bacterium]MBS1930375.1 sensor histidine kinase [Bacteroidota bacterium]
MQNRTLIKYKLHHVLFWLLVAGVWYFLRYQDYDTKEIAMQITMVKTVALAIAVYITNLFLIPQLLYKKKYFLAVITFILLILLSSFIKVFVMGEILNQPDMFSLAGNLKLKMYENVITDFFLVLTGASFKLMYDQVKMQQRLVNAAKEKAETELNFLKSQINPHFLFNSLNSVYFLINKENEDARDALHKFSEMLRYQLYEVKDSMVPVEKELSYLKDYVVLQKLRKNSDCSVEFNCSKDVKGFSIEPLLLIPFVENAFKHISHFSNKENFIKLDIHRSNGSFCFSVLNSREHYNKTAGLPGGIGLNNVKRRLELIYPGKHDLEIRDDAEQFFVNLKLYIGH